MDEGTIGFALGEAIRMAIDEALDRGLSAEDVKAEVKYQIENYDWDA